MPFVLERDFVSDVISFTAGAGRLWDRVRASGDEILVPAAVLLEVFISLRRTTSSSVVDRLSDLVNRAVVVTFGFDDAVTGARLQDVLLLLGKGVGPVRIMTLVAAEKRRGMVLTRERKTIAAAEAVGIRVETY